jgi:hypothetical protein
MKSILLITCVAMCAALNAQTPATPTAKPAGLGKAEATSNEEMNIRAYIELLRTDVKKARTQIMGDVMELDAEQASKFWPIYKEFENEYSGVGDQIVAAVRSYADHYDEMTDAVADQLANQVLNIEQQRNALKKKYYGQFKEALGAITSARFLQVENQLERLMDLQVAASLPVISAR